VTQLIKSAIKPGALLKLGLITAYTTSDATGRPEETSLLHIFRVMQQLFSVSSRNWIQFNRGQSVSQLSFTINTVAAAKLCARCISTIPSLR
jgi:hypothetical protein